MSVRRDKRRKGKWFYRKRVKLPSGEHVDVSGYPSLNTKLEAERAERAAIQKALDDYHSPPVEEKEAPKFRDWFTGRYWTEWVVGTNKKPGTAAENRRVFDNRLDKAFGNLRLDQITIEVIARYRAKLVTEVTPKTANNILNVLSKALHYAEDVQLIERAPRVGLLKTERPEIVCWTFEEYPFVVAAAGAEGAEWRVAALLAGDAGLRIGEIRALKVDDVDLVAGTITVSRQTRHGVEGTPKGGTRRVVPMTQTLQQGLQQHVRGREGYVIANDDSTPKTDGQTGRAIERIYERAKHMAEATGIDWKERNGGWHLLRHTFGTHAALCGVQPWTLMRWMGHKRIDETQLYVHFADAHRRPLPPALVAAGIGDHDPDRRILAMLGCRCSSVAAVSDVKEKAA